ncbi:MAG: long-chain fatty acid--CoA ligase [Acidobacteriaceae bacterium]
MLDLQTVNSVFEHMSGRGDATVVLWQTGGEWKPITSQQMYGRVRAMVGALKSWGVQAGDRVALLSENRWEWAVADFATLAMGAVDVPLYQTLTPEQMGFMLNNSGAKVVIVSTREQYDKVVAAGELSLVERVVVMDQGSFPNAESFAGIMQRAPELEQKDAAFDAMVKAVKPGDLATIIYTSGTTGDPKGVMLTHGNLASNLRYSTDGLDVRKGDISISFLPLSHVTARHLDYALYTLEVVLAYNPKIDNLAKAMKAVRPTVFLAVPRVYEKIRQGVEHKSTGVKGRILKWALARGKANRDTIMRGEEPKGAAWKLANKLVYMKIREAFGGRARVFIAGGAPLGIDTAEWFADVGIRVFEGYGMTETSPVISRNTYEAYRIGTVGKVVPNMEARIASDGELEVKGPAVFVGYWGNEAATKKEFTEDGWFKTGDIGKMEDGFLSITDRKKELLKTSGGKFIAPQPIENKLKADKLVGQAALIGDRQKFASVIISPDFPALEGWAKQNGVTEGDHAALVKDPEVQKLYEGIVAKVNGGLAHFESIKKVGVVPDEWSVESGEMTPSMKLKRRVVTEKYKDVIAGFYSE